MHLPAAPRAAGTGSREQLANCRGRSGRARAPASWRSRAGPRVQQWGCFVLSPRTALSRPQRALGTVLGTWPRAESGGVAFSLSQTQIKRPGLGLAASRRANEPGKWVTLTRAEVVLRCGARLGTRLLVLGRPGAAGRPAEPPAPEFWIKPRRARGESSRGSALPLPGCSLGPMARCPQGGDGVCAPSPGVSQGCPLTGAISPLLGGRRALGSLWRSGTY